MNTSLPSPKSLKFLYFRYKDSSAFTLSVIGVSFLVVLVLIFKVLLPQVNNWFSIRQEVATTRQQIQTLASNISFVGSLSDDTLNQDLKTVSEALPSEKSFIGILNSISDSAVKSGVLVDDYTFNLGVISGADTPATVSETLSPTQITIVVEGSLSDITSFLKELEQKTPLTQVQNVSFARGSATVILTYYYKPFSRISFDDTAAIQPFPKSTTDLIKQLDSWRPTSNVAASPPVAASASADPF